MKKNKLYSLNIQWIAGLLKQSVAAALDHVCVGLCGLKKKVVQKTPIMTILHCMHHGRMFYT